MSAKIYGIKKVASEMKHIPNGFHLEIWACKKNDGYEVWTSALLTPGSWTVYKSNPEYVCLDRAIREYRDCNEDLYGKRPSITESIRAVIEEVFE